MSLINNMLRNLEQRHAAGTPLPDEVRSLPNDRAGLPVRGVVVGLVALAVVGAAVYLAVRDPLAFLPGGEGAPASVAAASVPAVAARPAENAPAPAASSVAPAGAAGIAADTSPAAPLAPASLDTPVTALATEDGPAATRAAGLQLDMTLPSLDKLVAHGEKAAAVSRVKPASAGAAASAPVVAQPPAGSSVAQAPTLSAAQPATQQVLQQSAPPAAMPRTAASPAKEKPAALADPHLLAEADKRAARDAVAQGRRGEAEHLLKQALARAPGLADAAMMLARLQVDRGDLPAAWETLETGLPHARDQATYRAFCGTVLQRLNRPAAAIEHYHAALRLNPDEGRWWVGLGLALESAGKPADAREAFLRARGSPNLPPEMAVFAEQKLR